MDQSAEEGEVRNEMGKRSKKGQSDHDRCVRRTAESYQRRGYKVQADVKGFDQPESMGGYRPDVIAEKGGHETVIEVETPESVDSTRDRGQQKAFKQRAARSDKRHYKRIVTDKC